jgi:hypothetical protein
MCKIVRFEKMMWPIFMKSNKRNKSQQSFEFTYSTSRKPMRCIRKLLKIKSKLILIHFTSYVEYVFFFSFFSFVVLNVVDKIDKETLRIGFRIDPTF